MGVEFSLQGEALSADISALEPFCQLLKDRITERYSKCQIFNRLVVEINAFYRSLIESGEKQARNFKKLKDITIR